MSLVRGVAKVLSTGVVKVLEGKTAPDQIVTEGDVAQPKKLARLLTDVLRDLAALKRRAYPRRIDFEDITCGVGGALVYLRHGFNGRVRWWVVDWQITGTSGAPILQRWTTTDANTLVLWSDKTGVATIRVEEAG